MRGHRSASRLVSHPAAAHTLEGVSDVAPGSHVATPYGLRSAAAGLPGPNRTGHAISNYTAGRKVGHSRRLKSDPSWVGLRRLFG